MFGTRDASRGGWLPTSMCSGAICQEMIHSIRFHHVQKNAARPREKKGAMQVQRTIALFEGWEKPGGSLPGT